MMSTSSKHSHRRGHYSDDGLRWWDDDQRRWFVVDDGVDALHVEIEQVESPGWPTRLTTAIFAKPDAGYFRFVADVATDEPADPVSRLGSPAFASPPGPPFDGEPTEQWTAAARHCLRHLSSELIAQGWEPVGGPDTRTYVRPTLIAVSEHALSR